MSARSTMLALEAVESTEVVVSMFPWVQPFRRGVEQASRLLLLDGSQRLSGNTEATVSDSFRYSFVIRHSTFQLLFHSLDVRAELAQLFIKMFVATVDVVNAANFRNSVRLQSGEHQSSRRA